MHTNEAFTRSVTIAAPPEAVLDFVADPLTIPQWAPDFGREVRPAGDGLWQIDAVRARVRVSRELGTVDFLAPHEDRGAFTRVVPNGAGSEFTFTLFLPESMGAEAAERQRVVVERELARVRDLCEAAQSRVV